MMLSNGGLVVFVISWLAVFWLVVLFADLVDFGGRSHAFFKWLR